MIREALKFIERYTEPSLPLEQSKEWKINRIFESFPKIIIVEAEGDLKYKGFKFLISDEVDVPEDMEPLNGPKWVNHEMEAVNTLDFERYINRLNDQNKCIGSKSGLLSCSLFHFHIGGGWFDSEDGGLKLDKKIRRFKYSDEILKEIIEDKKRSEARFIQKLNGREGVRRIYANLVKDLLGRFKLKREDLRNQEDISAELKSLKDAVDDSYVYLRIKGKEKLCEDLLKRYTSLRAFLYKSKEYIKESVCHICGREGKTAPPSSFTTFQDKKSYLKHRTKKDSLSLRMCRSCSLKLLDFERFLNEHDIDFFPIFTSDEDLTEEINYLKDRKDRKIRFFDVVERLITASKRLQHDFVLLFRKRQILYYDYVSNYSYKLGKFHKYIGDVEITDFNLRKLASRLKEVMKLTPGRFFGSLGGDKGLATYEKHLIYRHREDIFNLLYRGEKSLSGRDMSEITSEIIDHRILGGGSSLKDLVAKKTIDIYLNSGLFTRKPNKFAAKKDGDIMLDEIRVEKEKMVKGELKRPEITSNEKFAYYLGQAVYYLVHQSEARDKMRLVVPIVNCRAPKTLKRAFTEKYLGKYIRSVSGNKDFKHRILSEVLGYMESFEESFSEELKVPFYAGFFDDNIFLNEERGY